MFDFSLAELMVVAVLAIVLIGPKDMPVAVRAVVRFMKSVRAMTTEMQKVVNSIADDDDVKEIKASLEEEKRYIMDEAGYYREVYDISEFMKKEDAPEKPTEKTGD